MYNEFVFGKDVFMKTEFPIALDSNDNWSPPEAANQYFNKPMSILSDFWSGEEMANALLDKFPGKDTLLDLGTATGSVPLTMRMKTSMKALGIEGLPVPELGIEEYMLKDASLYCWNKAPELLATCDITKPFRIEDNEGKLIQFDYIISTDCFEHLVTERIPELVENIYNHLKDDGYGIFEINTGEFYEMHQTIKPEQWWLEQFRTKFNINDEFEQWGSVAIAPYSDRSTHPISMATRRRNCLHDVASYATSSGNNQDRTG